MLKTIEKTLRIIIGLALMAGGIAIMMYSGFSFNADSARAAQWMHYIGLGLMIACLGGLVVIGGFPKRKSTWQ